MAKGGTRRGNYAFVNARVKVKKSMLLSHETYPKLLQMSIPEITRFIQETQYRQEVDELAIKFSGINLIEHALNLNQARTYKSILSWCQGELQMLVDAYLNRWNNWNIKTIIRGKFRNVTPEDIEENLVPAGHLDMEFMRKLTKKPSLDDVIDELMTTEYGPILTEPYEEFKHTGLLTQMEDAMDRFYFLNLLGIRVSNTNRYFHQLILKEIDFRNINTLFRLKRFNLDAESVMPHLIPAGYAYSEDDLRRLAGANSFSEMISTLREFPIWSYIQDIVEGIKPEQSLNRVENALKKDNRDYADKMSNLYPLSIYPVIGYIINKNREVNNLRIITRGKQTNLSNEVISELLVT